MKNQEYTLYSHFYEVENQEVEFTQEVITESYNGQHMTIAVPVR